MHNRLVPTREASAVSQTLPRPGLYRHFKGGEYLVLDVAQHSETKEFLVIYSSVDDPATIWVRPVTMFSEVVEGPAGAYPRFMPTGNRMSAFVQRLRLRVRSSFARPSRVVLARMEQPLGLRRRSGVR
jgi:hypothetical protein